MSSIPVLALAAAVVLGAWALAILRRRLAGRRHQRHHAIAVLLDAADQLETRLRDARSEIEAIAGDEHDPVRAGLQEMLRQRLWLQQHGDRASLQQLHSVSASIVAARARIDQQLLQIERARASLH
ncbi:MAG: hypothetical protein ACREO8_13785 [Luteimonas sp.]